jgi:hypothetical protein
MRRWWLVLGLVAACGNGAAPHLAGDAAVDAVAPADAMPDAIAWSIAIDTQQIDANPFEQHVVIVTGAPNASVFVVLDRLHAGTILPHELFLDASGHGTATYVSCSPAIADCLGPANMLVVADQPDQMPPTLASLSIDIASGASIGDISGCTGSGNAMYVRSTDYPMPPTTWQSAPDATWSVFTYPDAARFTIDGAQRLELSLQAVAMPLATGVYTNAQLSPPSEPGRPALTIGTGGGCTAGGRYQIDDFTADPVDGTLESITVRFEASGCDDAAFAVGCLHYTAPQTVTPPAPPLPDPSKVAVTVYEQSGGGVQPGTPDATAIAILTDATGAVVLDTTVDSFGFAQAPLIGSGELTVIQHSGFSEYAHTYRGVHAGDHVVINAPPVTAGREDQMLATWSSPPHANALYLMTACGGGSWSGGNGLVAADLSFYEGCRTPTFDMLSIAGFSDGSPQQWTWQTGLDHLANGNVYVAGPWAPFDTATVTVTNVPANTPSLAMALSIKIGAATPQMATLRIDGPPAGDVPFAMQYPLGAGDAMVIVLQTLGSLLSGQSITKVVTGSSANVSIDYAANPVPLLSAVHQIPTGASWTETGGGSVDVRTVFWSAVANNQNVTWTIVEPYDGHASSVLPALPSNHAVDDPATDPAAQLKGAGVVYDDYDASAGFSLTPPAPPYVMRETSSQTYGF